jgi:hypothetical protein
VSRAISHRIGLGRFRGYQGSDASFRLASEAINGVLMAFLWEMLRAITTVFGKEASYG